MVAQYIPHGINRFLAEDITHIEGERFLREKGKRIGKESEEYTRMDMGAFIKNERDKPMEHLTFLLRRQLAEEVSKNGYDFISDIKLELLDGYIRMVGSGWRMNP